MYEEVVADITVVALFSNIHQSSVTSEMNIEIVANGSDLWKIDDLICPLVQLGVGYMVGAEESPTPNRTFTAGLAGADASNVVVRQIEDDNIPLGIHNKPFERSETIKFVILAGIHRVDRQMNMI